MNINLFFQAIFKFALGLLLVGALIFLPAGSFAFANGWLLLGVLFVPMFCAGIVMLIYSPALLAKRLQVKENRKAQDLVIKLSGLMFICGFILAGLNHRFAWHTLPRWMVISAAILFLIAYILYAEILRENAYLSRTIEVQEGQRVVDTGLYGIVRHPMYSATLLLFITIPLILGAIYALPIFLLYPFIIAQRIKDEEKLLKEQLDGYANYMQKVKYRLIPFIW